MSRNVLSLYTRRLIRASFDWAFPRLCYVCDRPLTADEDIICLDCNLEMPRTALHLSQFNTIHQRVAGNATIDTAAGWFYYYTDSPYARLIKTAKYNDRPMLARRLGQLYAQELAADGLAGKFDVYLPVPLYFTKKIRRGYNQSREIAIGMADILGGDVGDNLVARRSHHSQTSRGALNRFLNVRGTYSLKYPEELDGLRVAIVDDIVTTGSTLLDCVNAIALTANPASISILTLGVTRMR